MESFEKETSIWYSEENDICNIYTYNKAWIKRLNKLSSEHPGQCYIKRIISECGDARSVEFVIPKKWVSIRPPRKLNLTDEQRQAKRVLQKSLQHDVRSRNQR